MNNAGQEWRAYRNFAIEMAIGVAIISFVIYAMVDAVDREA